MRQFHDRVLDLFEVVVEPAFQLRHRHARGVTGIELGERQTELRAELFERHFRNAGLAEDMVGRLPHRGQVVHQRARPIQDDVPQHERILPKAAGLATPRGRFSGATRGRVFAREERGDFGDGVATGEAAPAGGRKAIWRSGEAQLLKDFTGCRRQERPE